MMTMEATKAFTSTEVYFPFLYFQFSIVSESCGGSETKQDNGKVRCYIAIDHLGRPARLGTNPSWPEHKLIGLSLARPG